MLRSLNVKRGLEPKLEAKWFPPALPLVGEGLNPVCAIDTLLKVADGKVEVESQNAFASGGCLLKTALASGVWWIRRKKAHPGAARRSSS